MRKWNVELGEEDKKIFQLARWGGFKAERHERYADGSYVTSANEIPNVFLSNKRLYIPYFAPFTSTIVSLIELNMNKEDESCGVYFSVRFPESLKEQAEEMKDLAERIAPMKKELV